MSDSRPTVDPSVLSAVIDGAPDRVRRRFDRTPDAAVSWQWQAAADHWSVQAGNELVRIPNQHVASIDDVRCSCLLAPNCFHIIACLTALEVAESVDKVAAVTDQRSDDAIEDVGDHVQPEPAKQRAATALIASIDRLLNVGVSAAGVAVQSGLMRAVHQCRACRLHRVVTVGLRVIEGVRQVRRRVTAADPQQLAEDIADCVQNAYHLQGDLVDRFWIGTARRQQYPIRPKRLHGLLAEPILTRSGYAGAAAYLLGENDQIYTVADVRPGGAELCRSAYRGGFDIGSIVEPAIKLARGQYLCSELTASRDGRLGRGKSVKIAHQGDSDWNTPAIRKRFETHPSEQWDRVYQAAALPLDVRPAGWDLVFLTGSVIGAAGAELLIKLQQQVALRLAIANDAEELCFRENLKLLAHAPGLALKFIGRLDLTQSTTIEPLVLACNTASVSQHHEGKPMPQLDLPAELAGRVCLGLDPMSRHSLVDAAVEPVVLGGSLHATQTDLLAPLRRRWIGMMLGGTSSQHRTVTNTIAGEIAALDRSGFVTGASLLDAMSRRDANGTETFVATAIYLRRCTAELARSQATLV